MKTRQQIVDEAVRGLRAQGFRQSLSKNGEGCQYRGEGGLKCAIGHCMPDDKYDPGFDHETSFEYVLTACAIRWSDRTFARNLQSCHDGSRSPQDMEESLRHLCRVEGLIYPEA